MKKLFTTILFTLSTLAYAEVPLLTWDNQDGFKFQNCELETTRESDFSFASYYGRGNKDTENLRNYAGVRQSHLVNFSLVKNANGKSKRSHKYIEVVGVNNDPDIQRNRWFSRRGDKGYLYHRSINPIEDYVLILDKQLKFPFATLNRRTYWSVAFEGSYYKLKCENSSNRNYLVFKVFKEGDITPQALVGVSSQETNIFADFMTGTYIDTEKLVPGLEDEIKIKDLDLFYTEAEVDDFEDDIETAKPNPTTEIFGNSTDLVVCTSAAKLAVRPSRDEMQRTKKSFLFWALKGERVKVAQSFNKKDYRRINGVTYEFVNIELPDRESNDQKSGWVAKSFIQQLSKCKYVDSKYDDIQRVDITSLNDEHCCEFPTSGKPKTYTSGERSFGSRRSSGKRKHAACDLYRQKNEPVLAVAPGLVLNTPFKYYMGTYAVDILHPGGFIVRYGEISKKRAKGIRKGAKVDIKDVIGYVGQIDSKSRPPMLHFELYSGEGTGKLSDSNYPNKFKRRSDLMNPTDYLLKWENEKF